MGKDFSFKDRSEVELTKEEVQEEVLEAKEECCGEEGCEHELFVGDCDHTKLAEDEEALRPFPEKPELPEKEEEEPEPEKPETDEAKPVYTRQFIHNLRLRDPGHKKTCSACATRVPLAKIGKSETCDDCK